MIWHVCMCARVWDCRADLSGQAYSSRIAKQWADRVVTEFRQQAVKEKAAKLPVAQFMAELTTPYQVAKLQVSKSF